MKSQQSGSIKRKVVNHGAKNKKTKLTTSLLPRRLSWRQRHVRVLSVLFLVVAAGGVFYVMGQSRAATTWQLYWSDEFNGTSLDTTRWKAEYSTYGDGNNELACLTPNNVVVSDGTLKIISKKETITCPGKPTDQFSSGFISSRLATGKILYPRFAKYEIRAKLPHGQGLWPGFWLRHRDGSALTEVDIMEYFHAQVPGKTTGTLHYNNSFNVSKGTRFFEAPTTNPGWHTWAIEMEEVTPGGNIVLRWLLDDVVYNEYTITNRIQFDVADNLFDIAINTAVGGNWVGHPDDPLGYLRDLDRCAQGGTPPNNCTSTDIQRASFPMTYELDYIRVYVPGTGTTPTPPPTIPPPPPTSDALPVPSNFRATSGDSSVILSWDPATDTRVDQYSARYIRSDSVDKSNGSAWTYPGRIDGRTTGSTTITGLANGVSYDFQIRSVDELGATDEYSEYSATITDTPQPVAVLKSGDVNGDSSINGLDLSTILTNYGKTGQTRAQGDLNGDGSVNGLDLSQVLANYGK